MTTLAPDVLSELAPARLVSPELHATGDPHRVWRWMRHHAPVHWHPPAELPGFWSLTRYQDIRAAYSDPQLFSSAHGVLLRPAAHRADPGASLTLALTDPPRHKQLRRLMADWFTTRSVRYLEDSMRAATRAVLARAVERGECDFVHDVAARLSLYVICRIMGVPDEDLEPVFAWTNEAFEAHQPLAQHQHFMQYFIDLMYQRMTEPTEDLVSALVTETVDGELLTEEEIVLNCENLVGASENARLSLAAGMLSFLQHPDQWRRLREDRGLLDTAGEEILRWNSSATHSMRSVTRPTVIRGQQIEAGDWVVLWIPSANRDEDVFPDPDRFDIGRRPNRHIALGAGEHFCIGSILARAELRILFSELLDMTTSIEQNGPVAGVKSIAVRGPETLPVRIVPR
jgi:cytochrome P450